MIYDSRDSRRVIAKKYYSYIRAATINIVSTRTCGHKTVYAYNTINSSGDPDITIFFDFDDHDNVIAIRPYLSAGTPISISEIISPSVSTEDRLEYILRYD